MQAPATIHDSPPASKREAASATSSFRLKFAVLRRKIRATHRSGGPALHGVGRSLTRGG